ncbi:pyridoxal phosphate-dependent aminotransferase family protein [Streptomyces sp. DH12]|uniref:aminotransferase class I/II-fold pyridoxal phosphate-dependent enzyme n=1 Tax=Streptomyces sp. DH12 TaxID=2857010 RepID=UPI001E6161A5|nr:pyridoxal phosphate-dependent aminotransferase family protein [Streptomyces sp. DH12]
MPAWASALPSVGEVIAACGDTYPYFRVVGGRTAPGEVTVEGRRVVNAASADYLGLACDPRLGEAAARAARDLGTSCSGSPLLTGTMALHVELEEELADFLRRPSVLLATTGFQANLTLACLFAPRHLVVADRHAHASLVDATRLGRSVNRTFRHNDADHLGSLLAEAADEHRPATVVTEGAFSLDGGLAPLPRIAEQTRRHGASLILDSAHDIGVYGPEGRGAADHFGCEDAVDVITGTFSKAFGSIGGFVAGDAETITAVRHYGRATTYSASMAPAAAAAALAAVRVVRAEPERRTALWEGVHRLHRGLAEQGRAVGDSRGPAVALPAGPVERGTRIWKDLLDAGVFTSLFLPPAVPGTEAVVRLSVSAAHTPAQIDRILDTVDRCLPAPATGDAAHGLRPPAAPPQRTATVPAADRTPPAP